MKQSQIITGSDSVDNDWFGDAIDVSGNTLISGAYGVTTTLADNTGRPHIFFTT